MVLFSKSQLQVVGHPPCSVLHPWTANCYTHCLNTFLLALKGGSKLYFPIYFAGFTHSITIFLYIHYNPLSLCEIQVLLKRETQPSQLIQTFIAFIRSCLFCGFSSGSSVATMCFLRWLNGQHKVTSLGMIPGLVAGLGVFLDHPSRRGIDCITFIALVTDLYLQILQDKRQFTLSSSSKLLMFSISSTSLLYLLRIFKDSRSILWPFPSPRLAENVEDRKTCPHKEPCLKSIQKVGKTYFCYALALEMVKVTAYNIEKLFHAKISFLRLLFEPKNLRLPLFAGAYVSLLKGVGCLLVKYRKQDEAWHIIPAGIIASLSYLIHPNLYLSLIAFSNTIQIGCKELKKDLKLPSWPWQELTFVLLMGLLFHARATHPLSFPPYMAYIMDSATAGRAKEIYVLVEENLIIRS